MVAWVRPDQFDLPLLLHVAGAMALVGALVVAAASLLAAPRRQDAGTLALVRFGFVSLLAGAVPAYAAMRLGAEWIASRENVGDPRWIDIGRLVADVGVLVLLVATVASGAAARASRHPRRGSAFSTIAGALALLLVAAYVVAIWAMTAKPN